MMDSMTKRETDAEEGLIDMDPLGDQGTGERVEYERVMLMRKLCCAFPSMSGSQAREIVTAQFSDPACIVKGTMSLWQVHCLLLRVGLAIARPQARREITEHTEESFGDVQIVNRVPGGLYIKMSPDMARHLLAMLEGARGLGSEACMTGRLIEIFDAYAYRLAQRGCDE